jgi:hypothetical protein
MELKIDNCLASNFTYATDDKIAMLNAAQIKNFFTNGICKGGVSKEHLDGKIKIHLNLDVFNYCYLIIIRAVEQINIQAWNENDVTIYWYQSMYKAHI